MMWSGWQREITRYSENDAKIVCSVFYVLQSSMVPSICKSYQATWVCSMAIHKTSTGTSLRSLTYDERCARLGINRLELRRLHADLTLCYKIIQGLVLLSCDIFFTIIYDHLTRGHSLKLFVPSSRVNCRQHFFAVRVTDVWNSLPEDVVSAKQLLLFVNRLKCVDLS